jgi:hypothetical protein
VSDAPVEQVHIRVPNESFRSVFLEMIYRGDGPEPPETVIAKGTGFFYRVDGTDFMVTARHNFTGWDAERNEPLSSRGVGPTHVRVGFWMPPPPGGRYDLTEGLTIRLYQIALFRTPADDDADPEPLWLEHPRLGSQMDVVALPVRIPVEDGVLYMPWEPQEAPDLWVTEDISIVGFPYGLNSNNVPIWVRGTIASEPAFMYMVGDQALPLFLADARTRKGQSGSPVLLFRRPLTVLGTESGQIEITQGTQSKLLGVYSGRVNADSDLGFVWRIGEVDAICRGEARGTTEPARTTSENDSPTDG